jgi:ankyrin repeat protein
MLLVKNFAAIDVTAQDQNGRSLLHIAVLSNNDAACSILITHPQINVNAVDLFGRTPMFTPLLNNVSRVHTHFHFIQK